MPPPFYFSKNGRVPKKFFFLIEVWISVFGMGDGFGIPHMLVDEFAKWPTSTNLKKGNFLPIEFLLKK